MNCKQSAAAGRVLVFPGLIMLLFGITSCAHLSFNYKNSEVREILDAYTPDYPEVSFAVLSDPHMYDVSLGTEGPDFREYLDNDRKMLVQSEELLLKGMGIVGEESPQFLIISGDLTKDGEKTGHRLLAAHLTQLENSGIDVYVVPGNHDILNPHAVRFTKDGHEKVDHVTPDEFSSIHADYGYGEAVIRDPNSLSYVAEAVEGLWLLALDSAYYEDNLKEEYPQTGGRFTQAQIDWIESVLMKAVRREKAVIAFLHHGVLEHYDSQEKYFGEYLVENYEKISEMLARYKVRLCFTGHYHAQDITLGRWEDGSFLYDIETGSLVTYPCPVRFVHIDGSGNAGIRSRFIDELPSFTAAGRDFTQYSLEYVYTGITGIAVATMVDLGMKEKEAEGLSGQIADAFIAHYRGDEGFTGETMLTTEGLSFMGSLVVGNRKALIHGLWKDKEPADNACYINLETGKWNTYLE